MRIGTTNTETPFLPESELPESARLTQTKSATLLDHEDNLHAIGGEDAGFVKAIEESMKEQRANLSGTSGAGTSRSRSPSSKRHRKH